MRQKVPVTVWPTLTTVDEDLDVVLLPDWEHPFRVLAAVVRPRQERGAGLLRLTVCEPLDEVRAWSVVEVHGTRYNCRGEPRKFGKGAEAEVEVHLVERVSEREVEAL